MTHFIVLHNLVIVAKAFKRVRQVDTFQRQLSNTSFAQYIQRMCTRQFKPKLVSRFLFLVYILFCLLQMQTMKKKREFYNWACNYYFLVEKTTYNLSYLFNAKLCWTSCINCNRHDVAYTKCT